VRQLAALGGLGRRLCSSGLGNKQCREEHDDGYGSGSHAGESIIDALAARRAERSGFLHASR